MAPPAESDDRATIRQLVKQVNAAWREGRPDELNEYFHEHLVMVPPGFQGRAEGREAGVNSYRDFLRQATVRDYRESEATVDVWGDTAVAIYSWEMVYDLGGTSYHETGWDLFVFARQNGKWLAVWRTLIPSPPKS
jgi:uncharacterized protein (TIGR02246 family)